MTLLATRVFPGIPRYGSPDVVITMGCGDVCPYFPGKRYEDSYDVLLFERDAQLIYLLGPTTDTVYRDAFRVREEESAAAAHSRTAVSHFEGGR